MTQKAKKTRDRIGSRGLLILATAFGLAGYIHNSTIAEDTASACKMVMASECSAVIESLHVHGTAVPPGSHHLLANDHPKKGEGLAYFLEGAPLTIPRIRSASFSQPGSSSPSNGAQAETSDEELPALILRQPEVVHDAWRQIALAIVENERLANPRPEPVFARAELWMMVGNYDGAIHDLLSAMRIAENTQTSPSVYATIFNHLLDALERYESNPVPPQDGAASKHYGRGVHLFWSGEYRDAEVAFTNAISLNPSNAIYWYMRAVTNRRMGEANAASHDVLRGAAAESNARRRNVRSSQVISREIQRLQGPDRAWLEDYRRGNPSFGRLGVANHN